MVSLFTPRAEASSHLESPTSNLDLFRNRIDICIEVPRLPYEDISSGEKPESSVSIKKRVEAARALQRERFRAEAQKSARYQAPACNAQMGPKEVRRYCKRNNYTGNLLVALFSFLWDIICEKRGAL